MSSLRQAFSLLKRPLRPVPRATSSFQRPLTAASCQRPRARAFVTTSHLLKDTPSTASSHSPEQTPSSGASAPASPAPQQRMILETLEPKLSLTFTCTAEGCTTRSTHQFTKRSYQKGIVLVTCPGCKNRHLIADHLGWFKESTEDGKLKTVEDLLRARGETVRRGRIDAGGVVEYAPE